MNVFLKTTVFLVFLCLPGACTILRPHHLYPIESERIFYERYSKKFGISFQGTENKKLILAVDQWLGTPYRRGGCSQRGVDCSCFVQAIFREVYGIALPRSSAEIYHETVKIKKNELREGDLIFLKGHNKKISHVGIYLKDDFFVHVTTGKGVVISRLTDPPYNKSFAAAGRVPQLDKTT